MTERYDLKVTSAIVIDGAIRKAGSVVTVDERTAKDLLRRGKAELHAGEPAAPAAGDEGGDGDSQDDAAKPSKGLNVQQLKDALTAKGIEFPANANKAALAELLDTAPAAGE